MMKIAPPVCPHSPRPTRRQLLRFATLAAPTLATPTLGAALLSRHPGGTATAFAQGFATPRAIPEGAQITVAGVTVAGVTVAGPEGGELDNWARTLIPALGRLTSSHGPIRRSLAGGLDGITGANQFTAQALPDGASALLVPGSAMLGWLRGDPSVQFDISRCIPLLAGLSTTVIAGRIDAARLVRGQKLRIGVSGRNGPELAAVLGLEQLGLQPIQVGGLIDNAAAEAAFAQHAVDLLLLRGPTIAATLAASGARPMCVLGMPDANGLLARDPTIPELPHLGELLAGLPADRLTAAWRATAVAAQMALGLLLPPLTPAPLAELWRRAAEHAVSTPELQALATTQATRLYAPTSAMHIFATDPDTASTLGSWLADHQRR